MITITHACHLLILVCCIVSNSIFAHSWTRTVSSFVLGHQQEVIHKEYIPSQNETIILKNISGAITVEGWSAQRVVVHAVKTGNEESLKKTDIQLHTPHKTITIETKCADRQEEAWVDYTIMVPSSSNVIIHACESMVTLKKITGKQTVSIQEGDIVGQDIQNSASLSTLNGSIYCNATTVPLDAYIKLEAQGNIELALPQITFTDIHAYSSQAYVLSTIPISIKPFTTTLDKRAWNHFKQEIYGFIGQQGKAFIELQATRIIKITESGS